MPKQKTHKFPGKSARTKVANNPTPPPGLPHDLVRAKFFIPRWVRAAAGVIASERNAKGKGDKTNQEKTLAALCAERITELRPDLVPDQEVQ